MANWHGYFGIENLNLNATQRATLVAALRQLGPASSTHPPHILATRLRLDGEAAFFEALFNENNLSIQAFRNRLGSIFSIDPNSIDTSVQNRSWGGQTTPVVTFSRTGTDYIRMALFGGVGASWQDSGDAARGYLAAFSDEWAPEEEPEARRAAPAMIETIREIFRREPAPEPEPVPEVVAEPPQPVIQVVTAPEPEPIPLVQLGRWELPLCSGWTWRQWLRIRDLWRRRRL